MITIELLTAYNYNPVLTDARSIVRLKAVMGILFSFLKYISPEAVEWRFYRFTIFKAAIRSKSVVRGKY